MSVRHNYTIPDYYSEFHCKTGDCRHPCCIGWDIEISMKEYFHLLGMECSPELRRKLDTAFHFLDKPSEEYYAMITPRWDGDCPLRRENGFCGLQCECGEEALPAVCRYYPRSPASEFSYHCCCANSCEAVLDLLFTKEEPITFHKQNLSFRMDDEMPHRTDAMARMFPAVSRACIGIMQDRSKPLSRRLRHLGELIRVMDVPYGQKNAAGLRAILPFASVAGDAEKDTAEAALTDAELGEALKYVRDYLYALEVNVTQFGEDAATVRDKLKMDTEGDISNESVRRWHTLSARMEQLFPDNERILEQVLVNHMCYDNYPFTPEVRTMWECHLALCGLYALLKVLTVCVVAGLTDTADGCAASKQDFARYIDVTAALFRLAEHTSFTHNTAVVARRWHMTEPNRAYVLCKL